MLGQFEASHLEALAWLFERDYAPGDASNTEEHDLWLLKPSQPARPRLTGFRMTVCAFTCGLGISKAIVAYKGLPSAPTTIELVLVVGVGSMCVWHRYTSSIDLVIICDSLFWLGLYERSEANPFPTFFSVDYGPVVFKRKPLAPVHLKRHDGCRRFHSPYIIFHLPRHRHRSVSCVDLFSPRSIVPFCELLIQTSTDTQPGPDYKDVLQGILLDDRYHNNCRPVFTHCCWATRDLCSAQSSSLHANVSQHHVTRPIQLSI